MEYQFQKREYRQKGCTLIRCGGHYAVIYKHKGQWAYRCGFDPVGSFIPSSQYAEGSAATKGAAIVQAEAAIVGHGPDGVDWMDVDIRYIKWGF